MWPWKTASRAEEIAVGTETEADKLQLVLDDPVDQHKVGFDMAVAIADVSTFERMVVKRWRKWLLGAKQVNHGCNLFQAFAAPNSKFEVS